MRIFTYRLLWLIGLLACVLKPDVGKAQPTTDDPCDALTQAVALAFQHRDGSDPENLALIASAARQARLCYGTDRPERRIWLLKKEVWSLDGLQRYEEALDLVAVFYESMEDSSPDLYKALFALDRLRLLSFKGDFVGAAMAYAQASHYAHALPLERRISLHLDGAYLYHQSGCYDRAADLAEKALLMASIDEPMALVQARALFVRSQARLMMEMEKPSPDARTLVRLADDLEEAAAQFRELGAWDRYSSVLTTLGMAYEALHDDRLAKARLEAALHVARTHQHAHSEIFALLGRGQYEKRRNAFEDAEQVLAEALPLAETSGVEKYTADVLLMLGQIAEVQAHAAKAEDYFRRVVDRSFPVFSEDAFRRQMTRETAQKHLLGVLTTQRRALKIRWALSLLALLLVLSASAGYVVWSQRRMQAVLEIARQQPPFALPSQPLSVRRLTYLQAVLEAPAEVAALVQEDDSHLARRLERGTLRGRIDLYLGVAAVEKAVEGREVGNPGDAIRMDLSRYFKKRKWTWPSSVEAWRDHVREHPPGASLRT